MKSLTERIDDADNVLAEVDAALAKDATLPADVKKAIQQVAANRNSMTHWKGMIDARDAAMEYLQSIGDEVKSSKDDRVAFGRSRIEFRHARLIGFEGYLSISWALADSITGVAGLVLCPAAWGNDQSQPAQLLSHFVNENKGKTAPDAIAKAIRQNFGWPIAVSYLVRNRFVHEGGQANGYTFFDEPAASGRFRVSTPAWNQLVELAKTKYGLDEDTHRDRPGWIPGPTDDLRRTLQVCELEIDSALGILLGCACHALKAHVAFILDQD